MKKFLSMILALTLLAAMAGTASAEATKITFWHSMGGVNGEAITKMAEDFNAAHAGEIEVAVEYQGDYDDAINKIKSAGMSQLPCDVFQLYDIGTRFMIDSGWTLPMQNFIDAEGYDISQIEGNIAAYYTVDGILHSMPFNSSTPLLYYNKDAFAAAGLDPETPPANFDEIMEMSKALTVKGADGSVTQYGIGMGNYGWFFEQWIGKMGKHYVDNNNGRGADPATQVVFDENGSAKDILTVWNTLISTGMMPYLGAGTSDALAAFIAGNVTITLGSTASLKMLLNNIGDAFELGTGYFPSINADDQGGVSIGGGSLWLLDSGDTAKEQAAWEFIKFMISPDEQAYWNAQTGYFPITVATHETAAFQENLAQYPQFGTAIAQLHDSAPQYAGALLSVFPEARALVQQYTEKLINGEMDVDTTVEKLATDVNKAIEIYNLTNE